MGCQNTKQHIRNLEYTMKKGERVINIKVETREDIVKKLELLKSVIFDFKQKIKDFEEAAARIVVSSINESYEGKLVESRIVEGQIYITIETPYGLRFPVNTVHRQIAGDLHIKETSFLFEQFSDTRSYFVFSSESYKQYKSYVDLHQSIATFSYIIDRLLCTSDIHITQALFREHSKF